MRSWASGVACGAVFLLLPGTVRAQELPRDPNWNGVVIGAAAGAGLGVLTGALTEELCSPRDCAILFAVGGAALGRVIDKHTGARRPVAPGSLVDDRLRNGALIGAGVGAAVELIDLWRHCGDGPDQVQCTTGLSINGVVRAMLWSAAVGALVDAAIPSRAPRAADGHATATAAGRTLSFTVRMRF